MDWLNTVTKSFTNVVVVDFKNIDFVLLDLSLQNPELFEKDVSSPARIQTFIDDLYQSTGKNIAYGGYLEQRGIYRRSDYFNQQNQETERNIHLGIDIWCEAGTAVLAPIKGKVHSFRNNLNFGDYGPTIILEHNVNGKVFYTLYGHLSLESLQTIAVGDSIAAKQKIATLGTDVVNGNYAPHLHFQIILDLQNNIGDYPGVCAKCDIELYKANCPDPNLILKIF